MEILAETWPIRGVFAISRGSRTEAQVLVCRIRQGGTQGHGECVPYARYGESLPGVRAQLEAARPAVEAGLGRKELPSILPPGAARNAIDCALWDLEARRADRGVAELAGLPLPRPLLTAYTISLADPAQMARNAARQSDRPLLKVKLAGDGDVERMAAVREAAPKARLVADANEAWPVAGLEALMAAAKRHGFELVEQPLPAGGDEALEHVARVLPVCADESAHTAADLPGLARRYDAVNIKLDKTGGLTAALEMRREARRIGLKVFAGCMVGTSLSMAPAFLLAQDADYVDLDAPLLLARDREPGFSYDGSTMLPPPPGLWG
jgi:L-alanine-DL-glutamate epimerase-like enolase superfamily enzyme